MNDLEAVQAVGALIGRLAARFVFSGDCCLLLDLPAEAIRGESFRAEFRIQQDVEGPGASVEHSMVTVRFCRRDEPLPESPWSVHVRGHWPARRDRLPASGSLNGSRLRKLFAPKRRREGIDYGAVNAEEMYVMSSTPADDVIAQIALFLLQTELVADSGVVAWLQRYLATFRRRGMDRNDFTSAMLMHLLKNKWWPEDARAWRHYIGITAQRISASDRRSVAGKSGPASLAPYDPSGRLRTVQEVSDLANRSRSGLYKLIQRGQLTASRDATGRMVIDEAGWRELTLRLSAPSTTRFVMELLRCSESAAHKRVTRQKLRGLSQDQLRKRLKRH